MKWKLILSVVCPLLVEFIPDGTMLNITGSLVHKDGFQSIGDSLKEAMWHMAFSNHGRPEGVQSVRPRYIKNQFINSY